MCVQLDLSFNIIGGYDEPDGYDSDGEQMTKFVAIPGGVQAIADALRVNCSLTSVSLLANNFDDETVTMLLKVKEEKPTLTTLCGLKPDQTDANFFGWGLTAQDAKLLAPEIAVNGSITSLDLKYNALGDEGWCAVFDALRDNPQNKIKEWNLRGQGINPKIAKSLAAYVAVSTSITSVRLSPA